MPLKQPAGYFLYLMAVCEKLSAMFPARIIRGRMIRECAGYYAP